MRAVYVSGPVIRTTSQWDLLPWVQQTYEAVEQQLKGLGSSALLPHVSKELDEKQGHDFFHAIKKRICEAEAFVGVFTAGDASLAVEASIASVSGKKILLVADEYEAVPRLLRGLPGVVATVPSSDQDSLRMHILQMTRPGAKPPGVSQGPSSNQTDGR